jgi:hypothetical protein
MISSFSSRGTNQMNKTVRWILIILAGLGGVCLIACVAFVVLSGAGNALLDLAQFNQTVRVGSTAPGWQPIRGHKVENLPEIGIYRPRFLCYNLPPRH